METSAGVYPADIVVNAAGAWVDVVAGLAGLSGLGFQPKRRTAFLFDPPAGTDIASWPLVVDLHEQFYFKPDAGRLIGSLADETDSEPCDAWPEDIDVAIAVDRIEQATTMRIGRPSTPWAGLRTFAPDRTPVAGFDPPARLLLARRPGRLWFPGVADPGQAERGADARRAPAGGCPGTRRHRRGAGARPLPGSGDGAMKPTLPLLLSLNGGYVGHGRLPGAARPVHRACDGEFRHPRRFPCARHLGRSGKAAGAAGVLHRRHPDPAGRRAFAPARTSGARGPVRNQTGAARHRRRPGDPLWPLRQRRQRGRHRHRHGAGRRDGDPERGAPGPLGSPRPRR